MRVGPGRRAEGHRCGTKVRYAPDLILGECGPCNLDRRFVNAPSPRTAICTGGYGPNNTAGMTAMPSVRLYAYRPVLITAASATRCG